MNKTFSFLRYPLYVALLPISLILSIIENNINKQPRFWQCFFLLIIALAFIALVHILLNSVLKNIALSGFFSAYLLILFFSFTSIYTWTVSLFGPYSKLWYLGFLALSLILYVLLGMFLERRKWLSIITKALNVFSIVFFFTGIIMLGISTLSLNSNRIVYQNTDKRITTTNKSDKDKPDIYYFIFDTMIDVQVASRYFDVSPGSFEKDMEDLGFKVVNNAGYEGLHLTISSLASLFNPDSYDTSIKKIMDEYSSVGYESDIDYVQTQSKYFTDNKDLFYDNYTHPQFYSIMRNAGYTIAGIGSHSMTPTSPLYDVYYAHDVTKNFDNDMFMLICAATPIDTIWNYLFGHNAIMPPAFGDANDPRIESIYGPYRDQINYFKTDVLEIAKLDTSPKLSICHILMPHYPFVYDSYGKSSINAESFSILRYKGQYEYTMSYMFQLMRDLISVDPEALIVIQGDHGITENNLNMSGLSLSKEEHRDIGTQVFLAVREPGGVSPIGVESNMNALNLPRLLMNKYAGTNFKLVKTNYRHAWQE